jgi:uncharacterized membrane protein YbhN (UPF0104 family)
MRGWKYWLGLVLGIAALGYFSRDLEVDAFLEAWGNIRWGWYSAGIFLFCFSFWLRCPRWKIFIDSLGRIPLSLVTQSFFVGMLANRIFPARLGEVVRCYLLKQKTRLSFAGLLATVAIEKAFDGLALLTLFFLAISSLPVDEVPASFAEVLARHRSKLVIGALGFPALLLAVAWLSPWFEARVLVRRASLASSLPGRALSSVFLGLGVLRRGGHMLGAAGWTILVWATLVLSEYCTILSFGWDLPLSSAVVLCAGVGIAVSVPQAPSFVGVYQLAVQWVMVGLYSIPLQEAKAFAVAIWITQILPVGIIGVICLRLLGTTLSQATHASMDPVEAAGPVTTDSAGTP